MSTIEKQDKKEYRNFDLEFLEECIERDNATLILYEDEQHFNRNSIIEFICSCNLNKT